MDSFVEEDEFVLNESKSLGYFMLFLFFDSFVFVFGFYLFFFKIIDDKISGFKKCEIKSIVLLFISVFTLFVIKFNNCVIDEFSIDSITEDVENFKSRLRNLLMDFFVVFLFNIVEFF